MFGSSDLEADSLLMTLHDSMMLQKLDFHSHGHQKCPRDDGISKVGGTSTTRVYNSKWYSRCFSVVACRYRECGQLECDVILSLNSDFRPKWNTPP